MVFLYKKNSSLYSSLKFLKQKGEKMEAYMAFANKTRVLGISEEVKDKTGLVIETNIVSGSIKVKFDDNSDGKSENWFSAKYFKNIGSVKTVKQGAL